MVGGHVKCRRCGAEGHVAQRDSIDPDQPGGRNCRIAAGQQEGELSPPAAAPALPVAAPKRTMREIADSMPNDKFDRVDLLGVRWALLLPGMYDELRLATDEQMLAYLGLEEGGAFHERMSHANPFGDWIPLKEGIAIRLGWCLDPKEFES